jgi:hypothetical protein
MSTEDTEYLRINLFYYNEKKAHELIASYVDGLDDSNVDGLDDSNVDGLDDSNVDGLDDSNVDDSNVDDKIEIEIQNYQQKMDSNKLSEKICIIDNDKVFDDINNNYAYYRGLIQPRYIDKIISNYYKKNKDLQNMHKNNMIITLKKNPLKIPLGKLFCFYKLKTFYINLNRLTKDKAMEIINEITNGECTKNEHDGKIKIKIKHVQKENEQLKNVNNLEELKKSFGTYEFLNSSKVETDKLIYGLIRLCNDYYNRKKNPEFNENYIITLEYMNDGGKRRKLKTRKGNKSKTRKVAKRKNMKTKCHRHQKVYK